MMASAHEPSNNAAADPPITQPRVWIVDDSPLDARKAQSALVERCAVQVFDDGSAVLEQLSTSTPPDVLVLDWVMPGITGIEVVRFLRSEKGRMAQVPVLLLTSQQEPQQIVEGLSAGANDYLAKPYAAEELRARVESLLRSSQLHSRALSAEKAFRDLLDDSPDALVAIDGDGLVTYANSEAQRIFGIENELLLGRAIAELLPEFPSGLTVSHPGVMPPALPDVTVGERIFAPSIRQRAGHSRTTTTISLRDVTERRQSDRRRLDFYSIIAHDLRSPLTAMLLRAEVLLTGKRGPLSAEATDDLRRFVRNIRSMVGLINDFLDLARLQGIEEKLDVVELDLATLISTTVDELRPLAEAGHLALEWNVSSSDHRVLGERTRLGQVLVNLLGNAIKYTPAGGKVFVHTSVQDNFVETSISDTGPGIPPEALPSLFERFTRVASTSRTTGTGLGLMIVREIVEAHGGRVGVRSEVGKGSSFWFRLPRVDVRPPRTFDS
ncbi:MAG TPA: ATP-binding protein [Polyangiaceae bacterium]|jgi:two-component system phosphate regulon sensor histidine kinase PhoR